MSKPGLMKRLCKSLAFHLVETETTIRFMQGDASGWQREVDAAKALIAEAGYDLDVLYPPAERPIAEEATS